MLHYLVFVDKLMFNHLSSLLSEGLVQQSDAILVTMSTASLTWLSLFLSLPTPMCVSFLAEMPQSVLFTLDLVLSTISFWHTWLQYESDCLSTVHHNPNVQIYAVHDLWWLLPRHTLLWSFLFVFCCFIDSNCIGFGCQWGFWDCFIENYRSI